MIGWSNRILGGVKNCLIKEGAKKIFKSLYSGSSGNASLLTLGKTRILIDCGIGKNHLFSKLEFKLPDLILLTHLHQDHFRPKVLLDLAKYGIKIYGSKELNKKINDIDLKNKIQCYSQSTHNISFRDIVIMPLILYHNIPNYGYLIKWKDEMIFYGTDTYQVPYAINDLTRIYIECNYDINLVEPKDIDQSKFHLELNDCMEFVRDNKNPHLKEVQLLHISTRYGDKKRFNQELKKVLEEENV